MLDLHIAEVPYPSGTVHFRYARYLSEDGSKWVRHGRFTAFYENGVVASEGNFEHGQEEGIWRDFHPNGQIASEGLYDGGAAVEGWRFWSQDGTEGE
ncbi:toxin-antitoxin system YwqK family antitoxin [Chitinimonas sp. JJ19]|uniref:toxin-antitoxin system YwqK family antitoxin n=1 Tax=Chitinimonas sp. JJ19 TaxID=3109352 RepID=UPI0030022136